MAKTDRAPLNAVVSRICLLATRNVCLLAMRSVCLFAMCSAVACIQVALCLWPLNCRLHPPPNRNALPNALSVRVFEFCLPVHACSVWQCRHRFVVVSERDLEDVTCCLVACAVCGLAVCASWRLACTI